MDWENKGYRAKEKNMNKATLVVMAAGIGSRFGGGIKQLVLRMMPVLLLYLYLK